jgi:hypothetical protein
VRAPELIGELGPRAAVSPDESTLVAILKDDAQPLPEPRWQGVLEFLLRRGSEGDGRGQLVPIAGLCLHENERFYLASPAMV